MHYVDGYSRGSEWALPSENGMNEVDSRAQKNRVNPGLQNLIRDGREKYEGEDFNDVMVEVGHGIEWVMAELISEKNEGLHVEPLKIPEFIDEKIKGEIEALE